MKKIVALLICCCLLFTGCAEFVESEKKRIGKEIDWIKDTVGDFAENMSELFPEKTPEPSPVPTTVPTVEPTAEPAIEPTAEPTAVPTTAPSAAPPTEDSGETEQPKTPESIFHSRYDTHNGFIYNTYTDFGFDTDLDWEFIDNEIYYDGFNGMSAEDILAADEAALRKMVYIPDFCITTVYALDKYRLEVYLHNTAADKSISEAVDNDSYAQLNIDWLESMGYKNVKRYKDVVIGKNRYSQVYGYINRYGELDHSRVIFSHVTEDGFVVNAELFCDKTTFYSFITDCFYTIPDYYRQSANP